ncbi:MAG TPA: arsenate reductase ArsC [Spirochaetota bacterium]|nr:arsenate reductase ArsC [Spirochaetota bacterium]
MKKKVLFICIHNSARSQMAEGLLRTLYGDRYEAYSAGTEETAVNPYAIEAMRVAGIDISGHRSKTVQEFRGEIFDLVVTVCDSASESCPFFPGKKVIHKSFEDPSRAEGSDEQVLAVFERIRDEIRLWIEDTLG